MKADPQWVRDSLVEDAVKPAHEAGKEVNVRAAEEYFVGVLDKLERKRAEAKPKPAPQAKDATADEFRKATGRELDPAWKTEKRLAKADPFVRQDQLKTVGMMRLRERLRWIKQRPDLYQQVKGLALALNSSNPAVREKAALKMREFIEKTNRLAGHDWRKPKPKKLVFGG